MRTQLLLKHKNECIIGFYMGVVYSSEELLAGRVPYEGAHDKAARDVIDQLSVMDDTVLTVVHGSVVNGTSNKRSDLDILVTYDSSVLEDEPRIVRAINGVLDDVGDETYVKLEANIWPAHEAVEARTERMYDLLFSRHLARSMMNQDWAVGTPDGAVLDIAERSFESGQAIRKAILGYTTYKQQGYTKAPRKFSESEKALAALQRAFEFPKSMGRKVRQLQGHESVSSPQENWEALESSGLLGGARRAATRLHELDLEYTAWVEELCGMGGGCIQDRDIQHYREWLNRNYPVAIDLGIVAASGFTNYIAAS
jgi:predicted nucleotidyltransferase